MVIKTIFIKNYKRLEYIQGLKFFLFEVINDFSKIDFLTFFSKKIFICFSLYLS